MNKRVVLVVGAAVVVASSCSSYNDKRGRGDAPIGKYNDGPAYVLNMPDEFMNVAFRCLGENGVYTHTRAAAPVVIANDPNCAVGGFFDSLGLPVAPDQIITAVKEGSK